MKHVATLALALTFLLPLTAVGQDTPPPDKPPSDELPSDTPPSDEPPSDTPPSDTPPSDEPPSDTPPAAEKKPPRKKKAKAGKLKVTAAKAATPGEARLNIDVQENDLRDVMERLARKGGLNVVVAPGVEEAVTVNLREIPAREAVEVIARMCRCRVREGWPGVLLVEKPQTVTIRLQRTPLVVACRQIAAAADLGVLIGPKATGSVTLDLKQAEGFAAIQLAARSAGVHASRFEELVLVTKDPLPSLPPPAGLLGGDWSKSSLVTIDAEDASLAQFAAGLNKAAGAHVLTDPASEMTFSLSLQRVAWKTALAVVARLTESRLTLARGGGAVRIEAAERWGKPVSWEGSSLRPLLRLYAAYSGTNLVIDPAVSARVSAFGRANASSMLRALARVARLRLVAYPGRALFVTGDPKAEASGLTAPKPMGKLVDVVCEDKDLAEVMEAIGQKVDKNVLVDPSVNERVSCHLLKIDARLAIEALADLAWCDVRERPGGILLLTQPPKITLQAVRAPLDTFMLALAQRAGVNLALGPKVKGELTLDLKELDYLDALEIAARVSGCKITRQGTDTLVVSRVRPAIPRAKPPADHRHAEALARALEQVRLAAEADDAPALDRATLALKWLVAAHSAKKKRKPREAAPDPEALKKLKAEFEAVFRQIQAHARARDPYKMSAAFQSLRELAAKPGGLEVYQSLRGDWEPRLARTPEVRLSIRLQSFILMGNSLLRKMAEAIKDERYADAQEVFEQIELLKQDMDKQRRGVFQRNAEALLLRGKSLADRAARLLTIQKRYPQLRVQALLITARDDPERKDAAIVNGLLVHAGAKQPGLPHAVEFTASGVRFREGDMEFVRELQRVD